MSSIITDKPTGTHGLPTEWLTKRVVGWMFDEAKGSPWWICALTRDGEFKVSSHCGTGTGPLVSYQDYAKRVLWHLNRHCHHGGAWLVGWIDNGRRFYLLFKDADGDIQIPIDCDKRWEEIKEWSPDDWAEQAEQAYAIWAEFHRSIEYQRGQQIKLAQGEKPLH